MDLVDETDDKDFGSMVYEQLVTASLDWCDYQEGETPEDRDPDYDSVLKECQRTYEMATTAFDDGNLELVIDCVSKVVHMEMTHADGAERALEIYFLCAEFKRMVDYMLETEEMLDFKPTKQNYGAN